MPLRVLIVPDKFKGTLTARAAAEAIALGWRKVRAWDRLELLPMSDGGDGFGEIIGGLVGAKVQKARAVDAAHRPAVARWWWEPATHTAIMEAAEVNGLARLPAKRFHPFELDTHGLGALFRAAARKGAERCLMGIGGSATNDGGYGLGRALGWRFLNRIDEEIQNWDRLHELEQIIPPERTRWFLSLRVAVDVTNPLLGAHGATRVYGPQKGLGPRDFAAAERCLRRLASVVRRELGVDLAAAPGAGAAGGLGFGLMAFAGAKLEPGFELFARHAELDRRLRSTDLVITGEGAIDASTLMGKGAGQVADRCCKLKIPCIGLFGVISREARTPCLFTQIHALTEITTLSRAQARAEKSLERLTESVARRWSAPQ